MNKPLQISQEARPVEVPKPSCDSQVESEFTREYLSAFGLSEKRDFDELAAQQRLKIQRSIKYDPNSDFKAKIQVKIVRFTDNYELIDIQVKLGYFFFPSICIINIPSLSLIENAPSLGTGAYGKVYKCHYRGKDIAIKCFKKSDHLLTLKHFASVLTQYCMLKIASALEAGPNMADIYGFDIIVFEDCIGIGMELCEDIEQYGSQSIARIEKDLKQNLLKLHFFGVIHHDIKNYNIAFSKQFQRFVFLDFGLSKVVRQDLQHKCYTTFRGTQNFCSQQMQRIRTKPNPSFVDLYYNDLFGLRATINHLNKLYILADLLHQQKISPSNHLPLNISDYLFTFFMKCLIFYKRNQEVLEIIEKQTLRRDAITQLASFVVFVRYNIGLQQLKLKINQQLKRIGRLEDFVQVQFEHIEDFPRRQKILEIIYSLRSFNSAQYYISQLGKGRKKESFDLLTDKKKRKSIKPTEYLHILSKAIQFNFTPFDLEQVNAICESALSELQRTPNYQSYNEAMSLGSIEIAQVSELLFHLSIRQKLKGEHFQIFVNVLMNVMVCNIFSTQTLLRHYSEVLQMMLPIELLLKYLLYFHANFQWMAHQNYEKSSLQSLNFSCKKINQKFIAQIESNQTYTSNQIPLIASIMNKKYSSVEEINQRYHNHSKQVKDLLKIHFQQKMSRYQEQNLQDSYNNLLQSIVQNEYNNQSHFQFYHFTSLYHCLEKRRHFIVKKLLANYQRTSVIRKLPLLFIYLQYHTQIKEWKITWENLRNKIKTISQLPLMKQQLPCFKMYRLLSNFLRSNFTQIQQKLQKSQIIQFCDFLEKLLTDLSQVKQNNRGLLVIQIFQEKIRLHSFRVAKQIGKTKTKEELREIYKKDYFSIRKWKQDQNEIYHFFDFYIRRLQLLYKILFAVGETKASYELQQILTAFFRKDKNKLRKIIYDLFYFISPQCQQMQDYPHLPRLVFLYDQVIEEDGVEAYYFQRQRILIDLIYLMHTKRPERCFFILDRMFQMLNFYNTAKNSCNLSKVIKILIKRNLKSFYTIKAFFEKYVENTNLQKTPYKFTALYWAFFYLHIGEMDNIFLKLIRIMPNVKSIYAAEFIGNLAFIYLQMNAGHLPPRKVRRLNFVVAHNCFKSINFWKVVILLMKPQTQQMLKDKKHLDKLSSYKLKLRTFFQYVLDNSFHQAISLRIQWNKIQLKQTSYLSQI